MKAWICEPGFVMPLCAFEARSGLSRPSISSLQVPPLQLLEYQWSEGEFDTLGKLGSAHWPGGITNTIMVIGKATMVMTGGHFQGRSCHVVDK